MHYCQFQFGLGDMASVWSILKVLLTPAAAPIQVRGSGPTPKALPQPANPKPSASERVLEDSMEWLSKRWALATAEEASGQIVRFPAWYFEPATARQLSRVKTHGLYFPAHACRGQFSDVIGLFEEPDIEDLDKLKFFGVKLIGKNRNQTRVRYELAQLDADPDSAKRWAERPASSLQKEFFRFAGKKVPTGLAAATADKFIKAELKRLSEERQSAWIDFCHIVEEFNDPEFRELEEIRKPSIVDLRSAFDALVPVAESMTSVDASEVAAYLLRHKPSLGRG